MIYKWKPGVYLSADAQKVGERLSELAAQHKLLTPKVILFDATDKGSALHSCFEWDDTKAAERFRLKQAGNISRKITVVIGEGKEGGEVKTTRLLVNVREDDQEGYVTVFHAKSDAELRRQVIVRAHSDLLDWRNRYQEYVEFFEVFEVVDSLPALGDFTPKGDDDEPRPTA